MNFGGALGHPMRPLSLPMSGQVPSPMPVSASITQDLHTRQTIDRLQCIQRHLKNPSTFAKTAVELLEWCSDIRAFQPQFHPSLMSCLMVVNDVAGKPGFDLELCYKLIMMCYQHKEKFPSRSADMLNVFYNRAQKLSMLRPGAIMDTIKSNFITPQSLPGSSPLINGMNSTMGGLPTSVGHRADPPSWRQPSQHESQHSSLSVLTTATVYGLPASQSRPASANSQSFPATYSQGHMQHNNHQMAPENMLPNYNSNYSTKSHPGDASHNTSLYPGGQQVMRSNEKGLPISIAPSQTHQHQPAAAAAAAAVAAAAAAATATATATATLRINDPPNSMTSLKQVNGGIMGHSMIGPMAHPSIGQPQQQPYLGSVPHEMNPPMNRIRPQAFPQYGRAASVPTTFPMTPMTSPRPLTHPAPPVYNGFSSKQSGRAQHFYNNNPPNMVSPDQLHSPLQRQLSGGNLGFNCRLPHLGSATVTSGISQDRLMSHQAQHSRMETSLNSQRSNHTPHYRNEVRFPNPQTPIPGNPTPPITPGSAHNVPPYPNMPFSSTGKDANEPFFQNIKNEILHTSGSDQSRLAFPVRDGRILGPFKLEHNRVVSEHAFHLKDMVYKTLVERLDLDLQFKCFHREDFMMHTNWPQSVQISVNSHPVTIARGVDGPSHKPLYLKRVCRPGRNCIEVTVSACCCSHLFVLQLVHRPNVSFVMKGLMMKRMLSEIHCKAKIKRHIDRMISNEVNFAVERSLKVALRCPISGKPIQIPARGQGCNHTQCFDLQTYLQLNSENSTWECPICWKRSLFENLEIDQFLLNILKTTRNGNCHLVAIDSNCNWSLSSEVAHHEPAHRTSTGPEGRLNQFSNGFVKSEPFGLGLNVEQEWNLNPATSSRQEPHMNALQRRRDVIVKRNPDAPPHKRLKSVTSPNASINIVSPTNTRGFSQSHDVKDFSRTPQYSNTSSFLGGDAINIKSTDMFAASDVVATEKKLNPFPSRGNTPSVNGGSLKETIVCGGNTETSQPPKPFALNYSNSLAGDAHFAKTSKNSMSPSMNTGNTSSSALTNQCSSDEVSHVTIHNTQTPVVSLPNCDVDLCEDNLLESLFGDGELESDTPPLFCEPSAREHTKDSSTGKNQVDLNEILPAGEGSILDMFQVAETSEQPVTDVKKSFKNSFEEDILSLFDS